MFKQLIFCLFVAYSFSVSAQEIVTWSGEIVEEIGEKTIKIKGEVADGWYIYSMNTNPDGPIPTELVFVENTDYALSGKLEEKGDLIEGYDELFEVNIMKYKDMIEYQQKLLSIKPNTTIKSQVTFMTCDKKRCLPPKTVDIDILN